MVSPIPWAMMGTASAQPARRPSGTIHQPSKSLPAGTARKENSESPVASCKSHKPAVCGWNGFNIERRVWDSG